MSKNTAIVTGDFHNSFVYNNLKCYPKGKQRDKLDYFPELVVPSITSANYDEEFTIPQTNEYLAMYYKQNPDLVWADLNAHGYLLMKFDEKNMSATFKFSESILKPSDKKLPDVNFSGGTRMFKDK